MTSDVGSRGLLSMGISDTEARLSRHPGGTATSSETSLTTTSIKDLAQAVATAAASPGADSPTLVLLDDPLVHLPIHNSVLTPCSGRLCPSPLPQPSFHTLFWQALPVPSSTAQSSTPVVAGPVCLPSHNPFPTSCSGKPCPSQIINSLRLFCSNSGERHRIHCVTEQVPGRHGLRQALLT